MPMSGETTPYVYASIDNATVVLTDIKSGIIDIHTILDTINTTLNAINLQIQALTSGSTSVPGALAVINGAIGIVNSTLASLTLPVTDTATHAQEIRDRLAPSGHDVSSDIVGQLALALGAYNLLQGASNTVMGTFQSNMTTALSTGGALVPAVTAVETGLSTALISGPLSVAQSITTVLSNLVNVWQAYKGAGSTDDLIAGVNDIATQLGISGVTGSAVHQLAVDGHTYLPMLETDLADVRDALVLPVTVGQSLRDMVYDPAMGFNDLATYLRELHDDIGGTAGVRAQLVTLNSDFSTQFPSWRLDFANYFGPVSATNDPVNLELHHISQALHWTDSTPTPKPLSIMEAMGAFVNQDIEWDLNGGTSRLFLRGRTIVNT